MAINPDTLGVDEDDARLILMVARDIAPCIDSFEEDTEPYKNALAILRRVAKEDATRPSRHVASENFGPVSRSYRDVASAFTSDDRIALAALCTPAAVPRAGLPVGSFPKPSRAIASMWPEEY